MRSRKEKLVKNSTMGQTYGETRREGDILTGRRRVDREDEGGENGGEKKWGRYWSSPLIKKDGCEVRFSQAGRGWGGGENGLCPREGGGESREKKGKIVHLGIRMGRRIGGVKKF